MIRNGISASIHRIQILVKTVRDSAAVKIIFGKFSYQTQFGGHVVALGSGCIGNVNRAMPGSGNIRRSNPCVQYNDAVQRQNVRRECFGDRIGYLIDVFTIIQRIVVNVRSDIVFVGSIEALGGCGGCPNLHQVLLQNGVQNCIV